MTVTRFIKKCDEFMICSEIGKSGDIFVDLAEENKTLYQIILKGSGRAARFFDTNYKEFNAQTETLIDKRKYLGCNMIYEAYEDYHTFGFNFLLLHFKKTVVGVIWKSFQIKRKTRCKYAFLNFDQKFLYNILFILVRLKSQVFGHVPLLLLFVINTL